MLNYEQQLAENGLKNFAGADEVGRGAFAGPVVVGCVVCNYKKLKKTLSKCKVIIRDSKKMTAIQRQNSSAWIKENFEYSIAESSNLEINSVGIVKATNKAYRRAVSSLETNPDHILLDAFYVPYLKNLPKAKQTAIIKGDSKSFLIACASIIAKVYRDELMTKLSLLNEAKHYHWLDNKGYGTKAHREAIQKFGPSKLHRKVYIKNYVCE